MQTAPIMRVKVGTGLSSADDGFVAGREAASAAVQDLTGADCALIVVYASVRYDSSALLQGVRAITGDTPLIGATSCGHFALGTYVPPKTGVAVVALSSGGYRFGVSSVTDILDDMEGAGQRLARACRAAAGGDGAYNALLLLADGVVAQQKPGLSDHQRLIHGIYRVTGPKVPTVGGVAGDDFTADGASVFHDNSVLQNGAVGVWIASERPLRVVTGHGWTPIGSPQLVTRAADIQILELAGRPAADVYHEILAAAGEPTVDGRFWDTGYRYPIGVLHPDGSVLIRVPTQKTDDGCLWTHSPVPAGSAVQVMAGSPDELLEHASVVAQDALAECVDPSALLVFSCASRIAVCGARIAEEAVNLQTSGVPSFGFYTYGEFARTVGTLGVHNATVTALAL